MFRIMPGNKDARNRLRDASEIDSLEALELLILRANRFVSRLAETEAFLQQDLGVADWLALRALSKSGTETFTGLARTLGVTRQRVKQIADSLKEAGLAEVSASGVDRRKAIVTLSDSGREALANLETALRVKLETFKGGMHQAVRSSAILHRLGRSLGEGPGPRAEEDDEG